MSKSVDRIRLRAIACGLFALGMFALPLLARGQDCPCPGKSSAGHCERGVPVLSNVPYLSRLFKNVGVAEEPAECDHHERFGIELKIPAMGDCPLGFRFFDDGSHCGEVQANCHAAGKTCGAKACPVIALINAEEPCEGEACTEGKCCAEKCSAGKCCTTQVATTTCSTDKCCADKCSTDICCPASCGDLVVVAKHTACGCSQGECPCKALAKLSIEKAKLEAIVEAQGQMFENKSELLEGYAQLAAEKARLEVRLELQDERDALVHQLLEQTVANASLQAKVELAEAKAALMQQMMQVAVENQHLKTQVAELSHKLGLEPAAIRTSVPASPTLKVQR